MQIHLAAKRGDNLVIERHLRRGVSVDAKDEDGKTPLDRALEASERFSRHAAQFPAAPDAAAADRYAVLAEVLRSHGGVPGTRREEP